MALYYKESFTYPYTNIKTKGRKLETTPIPDHVCIALLSAKNKIGTPTVHVGEKIVEGSPIGHSGEFLFYSSISGKIISIENQEMRINATKVLTVPVIQIQFSGRIINWEKTRYDYLNRSAEELKNQIIHLGVENFNPTSCLSIEDILNFPQDSHLIITGMEFYPMVTFCEELLLQKTQEIHTALSIVEYIIKPKTTSIVVSQAIKNQYNHSQKNVFFLDSTHPNGFEARIFHYFTGLEEVSPDLLKNQKCVILDTQTLYHIYNAIVLKKPPIEQLITIDGKVSKYPSHYFVRLGSQIKNLVEDIGIYDIPKKTVSGNIFDANIIYNLDKYINSFIYSLFLLDDEPNHYQHFEDCIQCNLCYTHCPVNIFPYELSRSAIQNKDIDKCIECGVCSYVCPAEIPLGYFLGLKRIKDE